VPDDGIHNIGVVKPWEIHAETNMGNNTNIKASEQLSFGST